MVRRRLGGLLCLLPILAMAGCGTLYNDARHQQAQDALKTFNDAKITEAVQDERTQNAAIAAREQQVVERQLLANRNRKLIKVINHETARDSLDDLQELINTRLTELGSDDIAASLAALADHDEHRDFAAGQYQALAGPDDPEVRCTTDVPDFGANDALRVRWVRVQDRCKDVDKDLSDIGKVTNGGGKLFELSQQITIAQAATNDVKTQVASLTKEFAAEKKAIKAANDAAASLDLQKKAAALKEKLESVKVPNNDALSKLGLDDVRLIGALTWLDIQRSSVAALLDAAGTGAAPAGSDADVKIAALLPSIADELNSGLNYPRVSALVLESEHLRIETDRLKRDLARTAVTMDLLRRERDLLLDEREQLKRASAELSRCQGASAPTFDALKSPCHESAVKALLRYANAWTIGRIPAEKITYTLINQRYEKSLDNSESALAQWQNLIATPMQALLNSYDSAIRPEQIGRLVSAAELAVIAGGVN